MRSRAETFVFTAAVLIGLLAAVGLLLPRLGEENRDRYILTAISYDDILRYAEASGVETAQALNRFAEAGVDAVVLTADGFGDADSAPEQLARRAGFQVIPFGTSAETVPSDAPLYIPDPSVTDTRMQTATAEYLAAAGIPVAAVENEAQNGYNLPEAYRAIPNAMVKGFFLWPDKAARYAVLGYAGAEEIENTLFRAAAERGMGFLWLAPFERDGAIVTDIDEYEAVIDGLAERLAPYRLTFGGVSPTQPFEANRVLLSLTAWGIAAAGIALLSRLLNLKWYGPALLAAALAGAAVLAAAAPRLLQQGAALAAAVVASCWSVCLFTGRLRGVCGRCETRTLRLLGTALIALAAAFATALLGGVAIAGLMSDSDFTLGLAVFRGVKLSQILPLAFAAVLIFWSVYHEKGRGLRGDLMEIVRGFRKHALLKCAVLVVLLGLVVALFVLRTGNVKFSVPDGEQRFRNWLETVLYARPRSKEFLAAYPAFLAMFWVAARRFKNLILPFSVLAAIGFASVVNTFCHARAPFVLSLVRANTGLAFGVLLGLLLFFCAEAIYTLAERRGRNKAVCTAEEKGAPDGDTAEGRP